MDESSPSAGGPVQEVGPQLSQQVAEGCQTCGQPLPSVSGSAQRTWVGPVLAVGQLAPQFSSLSVEKYFAQLSGEVTQGALVEMAILQHVLSDPDNRWLGRHLSWVLTTQHVDTFAVVPRDLDDIVRLAEMISTSESDDVVHVVIGRSATVPVDAPGAPPGLPAVFADQLLGFTIDQFVAALPGTGTGEGDEPSAASADSREQFQAVARDLFIRMTRRAGNNGIADEHRAINYLALQHPGIYHLVAQENLDGKALIGIDARHSHSGGRRIATVRFSFRQRLTELTERFQIRVDVTGLPFLESHLEPTYD